jgi:hypothetical protein
MFYHLRHTRLEFGSQQYLPLTESRSSCPQNEKAMLNPRCAAAVTARQVIPRLMRSNPCFFWSVL